MRTDAPTVKDIKPTPSTWYQITVDDSGTALASGQYAITNNGGGSLYVVMQPTEPSTPTTGVLLNPSNSRQFMYAGVPVWVYSNGSALVSVSPSFFNTLPTGGGGTGTVDGVNGQLPDANGMVTVNTTQILNPAALTGVAPANTAQSVINDTLALNVVLGAAKAQKLDSGGNFATSPTAPDATAPTGLATLQQIAPIATTQANSAITAQKGVANGIATLDTNGKLPDTQLSLLHRISVGRNTLLALPSTTQTILNFPVDLLSTVGFTINGARNAITVAKTSLYLLTASMIIERTVAGVIEVWAILRKNGVNIVASPILAEANNNMGSKGVFTIPIPLVIGDIIEVFLYPTAANETLPAIVPPVDALNPIPVPFNAVFSLTEQR